MGMTTLVLAFACGDDKKGDSCSTGDERCACYPNKTCNLPELVCLSNLCVSSTAGGSSATGGSSSSTTGGTQGEGGTSEGGSTSSGGSAGANVGGAGEEPTGGTTSSGGKASSKGGSTGTTGGASSTTGGVSTTSGGTSAGAPGEGGVGAGVGEGGSTSSPDGNLISNGDFASGSADWNVTFGYPTYGASTFTNGHACLQASSSTSFNLGWPLDTSKSFVLEPGVPYTLSFRAMSGFSEFYLNIKLGHVTTPYTAAYLKGTYLTTTWASYSFDVVAASGDSAAGLVFQGNLSSGNSLCVDDVVLVKN